ncbi:hypothetical protein [uncultured Eubacterium sp.]|uniref:hypothetical protein n=1 Tax=uncultured Eubacterium sp. TaxID=165185 RepID=UPI0026DB3FB2|nr:hypothetical protein [uncultured Eubacterium sp.]
MVVQKQLRIHDDKLIDTPDTGHVSGGGSPDYWHFTDVWESLRESYGERTATILQEFGQDGLNLAGKYGDDLAKIIDNLEHAEAKKAVNLINSYGDEALYSFKEGKDADEVKKIVEGGLSETRVVVRQLIMLN